MSKIRIRKSSWFWRIYEWYIEKEGVKVAHNLCPVARTVFIWAPITWFIDTGFVTKYKLIRPLTIVQTAGLCVLTWIAFLDLDKMSAMDFFCWVFLCLGLLAGIIITPIFVFEQHWETDIYYVPWQRQAVLVMLPVLITWVFIGNIIFSIPKYLEEKSVIRNAKGKDGGIRKSTEYIKAKADNLAQIAVKVARAIHGKFCPEIEVVD